MTALTRRLQRLDVVRPLPKPSPQALWNLSLLTDAQLDDLERLSIRHAEVGLDGLTDDELDELLVLVAIVHGPDQR